MKFIVRLSTILLLLLSVSGCAPVAPDPSVPLGLLTKSRDYLFFCLFIIDSGKPLYNQVAARYYYSMFSIAKISSIWKHKKFNGELETHKEVWSVASNDARKSFGEKLKKVRTKCDYSYDCNNVDSLRVKDEIRPIILDDEAFGVLIGDAESNMLKYYQRLDKETVEYNQSLVVISEIKNCRNTIKQRLTNHQNTVDNKSNL